MVRVTNLILLWMLVLASSVQAEPLNLGGMLKCNSDSGTAVSAPGHWDVRHPLLPPRNQASSPPAAVFILQREGEPLPVISGSVELVIDNLVFSRRALAVRANTILNISNRSRYALTLQLLDENRRAVDGVLIPADGAGRVAVPESGVYVLQALEFSHLSATVVVTPQGREIVVGADGRFVLGELSPGRYRILVWAGRWVEGKPFELGAGATTVTVLTEARAGAVVAVNVRVETGQVAAPAPPPPVPPRPEAPPAAQVPPRPASPPAPPAPAAPPPVQPPAKGGEKPKGDPAGPPPSRPEPADSSDDGDFFKIKEID